MKRLNYYQVHKNKKPVNRKVKRSYNDKLFFKLKTIERFSFVQSKIIISQCYKSTAEKALAVANNVIETANLISKAFKDQKKQRYLNRIKK